MNNIYLQLYKTLLKNAHYDDKLHTVNELALSGFRHLTVMRLSRPTGQYRS